MNILLEIAIDGISEGLAAVRAGADRLEVCSRLDVGGLTPEEKLVQSLRKAMRIPIYCMVRPREEGFVYSAAEFQLMLADVEKFKSWKSDGIVAGFLKADGAVDTAQTIEFVRAAAPLPVTFHRAFDETPDLLHALENVIECGVARILTSGGKANAFAGKYMLRELVLRARERVEILGGGGVRPWNVRRIIDSTGVAEVHSAARDEKGLFQESVVAELRKEIPADKRRSG